MDGLKHLKIIKKDVKKAVDDDIDETDLVKSVHTKEFKNLNYFEKLNYLAIHNYYNQLQWE